MYQMTVRFPVPYLNEFGYCGWVSADVGIVRIDRKIAIQQSEPRNLHAVLSIGGRYRYTIKGYDLSFEYP